MQPSYLAHDLICREASHAFLFGSYSCQCVVLGLNYIYVLLLLRLNYKMHNFLNKYLPNIC